MTCTHVGDLLAGSVTEVRIVTSVGALTPATIVNEATVTAAISAIDASPTDNAATTGSLLVSDPPRIPSTGADTDRSVELATFLLGLGLVLSAVGRSRRDERPAAG